MANREFLVGDRVIHLSRGPVLIGTVTRQPEETGIFGIVIWDNGTEYSFEAGAFIQHISPIEELALAGKS